MAKIRVHEIAKEYNVPTKDVMTFLEGHNIEVSSHMSTLEDNAVALVRGKYGKSGETDADKKERPKKKSSISAVYNPQNSKMSNRRSNNGNRNGDRPQRQNGDRPQRANVRATMESVPSVQTVTARQETEIVRREDMVTDRQDRKTVIEMVVMKEKTTIIRKASRVIAAAVIILEVIETIDRTIQVVRENREDA